MGNISFDFSKLTTIYSVHNGSTVDLNYLCRNNMSNLLWAKPFTLTIQPLTNISYITVYRNHSLVPYASSGYLLSGATIYYGDKLTISAEASSGYKLNKTSYTISEVVGNVTTDFVSSLDVKPKEVTLNGYVDTYVQRRVTYYRENITVTNNTGIEIKVVYITGSNLLNGNYSKTIENGSSYTFSSAGSQFYFDRATGTVGYTCNGSTYSKAI